MYKKKYKKILHQVGKAIKQYEMIQNNDRIMVAVSGGKDSLALLLILLDLQKKAPIQFELFAYTLDQGLHNFEKEKLEEFYKKLNIEYYIDYKNTYALVKKSLPKHEAKNKTYCSFCSRLRRGIIYNEAVKQKANKIALGHHADDSFETFMLNLMYAGKIAAMPPKREADDKRNTIIRPLTYLYEEDIVLMSIKMKFPKINTGECNLKAFSQRDRIKEWIQKESEKNPLLRSSFKSAMTNIVKSQMW